MSAFDLAGDHDSASLIDQARSNPLDLSQPAGFFTGMGTGLATGVGRLLADTQRTTGLALGAVAGSFDMLTGDALKAQDKVFEHIVTPADKLSRHLAPKPEEIGMAGQLLHGLVKIGGEAVAFGAPGVLVNETVGGTLDALDKGVDLQTAGKVGGVQGAAMTAGVIAPMTLGATGLGMNVLYGAGINLAQGIFQRGATAQIYEDAGRHDLALQFKAMDGEAMAVDAILGAAFAGGGRFLQIRGEKARADAVAEYKAKISEMLAPEHIDAALLKNEQLKMERSGMGLPADLASRDAHVANLTGAIDDLMEGRPVTMRQEIGDFLPDLHSVKVRGDIEAEIMGILAEDGRAGEVERIKAELLGEAGNRAAPGDVPRMSTELSALEQQLAGLDSSLKERAKAEQAAGLSRKQAEAAARKSIETDRATLEANANRLRAQLDTNAKASQAEQLLAQLNSGKIPDEFAVRVIAAADTAMLRGMQRPISQGIGQMFDPANNSPARTAPKVGAGDTAATPRESSAAAGAVQRAPDAAPAPLPDSIKPETVIPIDDADATTTVAEAQGIITDLETAAKEQETGLRAAVACFLRAA